MKGHIQGTLEPEGLTNSLRATECMDNEKVSGVWTQAINQYSSTQALAWRAAGRADSQALPALSCFPPPPQQGENREPMASSAPPLVSRDLDSS